MAVIGSGVAGLTAAHVIAKSAEVTLFEADERLGGHADTHRVTTADGRELAIDTGFIVHNERTYPTLLRLFRELGVETQPSEMSMSVRDDVTGLEYAGALGVGGLFPTRANLGRAAYLRMLVEIPRFHRAARSLLADGGSDDETLAAFLERHRFSAYFRRHFMEPMVAAVWSCDPDTALAYPARYLFAFLQHHGMLAVRGSPQWRTVTGGSGAYVARVASRLHDVRTGTKVTSLRELPGGVEVTDGNGRADLFDAVVVATHPHQALAMLADPTPAQSEVLRAIGYSPNTAQLHTDSSLLPQASRAHASWNFRRRRDASGHVTVTYDLTRLQRLPTDTAYLVTLGGTDLVDPASVIATREYEHPLYTPESVAAQRRLPECDTGRVVLAGAYHGWGFHEDGARSGAHAAARLGFAWDAPAALPRGGRVYSTTIRHGRRSPRRTFTYRSRTWLVDLDDLPPARIHREFRAADHLGDPSRSIRENVVDFLARRGIAVDGTILMLAHPRAFGHCFNPITVFWCHRSTGEQACVLIEVHNTYGDRHAYVVHPDEHGRATVPKQMYVSPFHDVSGEYRVSVPRPDDRVAIGITLQPHGFAASLSGTALPPGRRAALDTLLRTPWPALLGRVRIQWQGLVLWLRLVPVQPRPHHDPQEGTR
ncbi:MULTISPECIES: FAD-dependent oxidoreductase [unclassified Nocardioides]|uniref:FAD-dependent oxidoreductase n=1 Tax=unclassified Nocardioides TaxID=2615069 RepID=UPI00360D66A1